MPPPPRLRVPVRTASADGRYWGRWPGGDRPATAAELAAAAQVVAAAGGDIQTAIRLAGGAAGVSAAVADLTTSGSAGSYLLATGHYVPRESNMVIEHPRPDSETMSYAAHRAWVPGETYTVRICVRNGSWPLRYVLTGPSGATVGAQLVLVGDALEPDVSYAVVTWINPTAGTHNFSLLVYDQEFERGANPSSFASVDWTLTVSNSNKVWLSGTGSNTTGDGSYANPFRSFDALHSGSSATATYANYQVWIRGGTIPVDGMATNGNNYALQAGGPPSVFIGQPGQTSVLEMYEGWFVGRGAGDIMFKNVELRHASEFAAKMHFYATVTGASRISFHDSKLTNYFVGSNPASENPAMIYTTTGGLTSHLTMSGCEITGQIGAVLTAYMLDGACIEHNRVHDANTAGQLDGSNQWNLFYFKDSTLNATFRRNKVFENNTLGTYGVVGVAGQNNGGLSHAYNNIQIDYNFLQQCTDASIFMECEYGGTPGSVFIHRNSCAGDIEQFLWNSIPTPYRSRNNAVVGGFTNMPGTFDDSGSITGAGLFDANMKLSGANRTAYLGTHGAEVA